ncbi:hypothetical protein G9A89_002023 [Geosiphon pyriformis]|nr:hypothetical protein G9A89_002023 [Geosiphon pyriformis]
MTAGENKIDQGTHFYEDGDLLININESLAVFKVHKKIMELASPVFKAMFQSCNSIENHERSLEAVTLYEAPNYIEDLLTFIYPASFLRIQWENVLYLLPLSDKYELNSLTKICCEFLESSVYENPLETLFLAEKYQFPKAYKDSSKIIIDDFFEYRTRHLFYQISLKTKDKLQNYYLDFIEAIRNVTKSSLCHIPRSCHATCWHGDIHQHGKASKRRVMELIEKIQKNVDIRPSQLWKTFSEFAAEGKGNCENYIYERHIKKELLEHLGDFEKLEAYPDRLSNFNHYIYIEL